MLLNVMQKEICFCRKRTQSYDSTFCGALTDTSHNNNNINKSKRRKRLVRNLSGFLAKIYPINVGFSSQFKLEHKQSSTEEQLTIYRTLRRYTPFSNYYLKESSLKITRKRTLLSEVWIKVGHIFYQSNRTIDKSVIPTQKRRILN